MSVEVVVTVAYPSSEDIIVEVVNHKTEATVREARLSGGQYGKIRIEDNECLHIMKVPKIQ